MAKSDYNLIKFVKQSDTKCEPIDHRLDGNCVKEFYDSVVSSSDPSNEEIKSRLSQKQKSVPKVVKTDVKALEKCVKLESIFKFCQNGELEECRQWLQMGFDINITDNFSWTPLMCGSCAGHEDIVRLLLENKADIDAKETTGRTALDLAIINGHLNICQLLIDFKKSKQKQQKRHRTRSESKSKTEEVIDSKTKKCETCHYQYDGSDVKHKCSIVHQLTVKSETKPNKYFAISETNRGFQMLLRSGWTRDRGLGPEGTGRTAPIRTVLKKDRMGFGNEHKTPRVTHTSDFGEYSDRNCLKQSKYYNSLQRKRSENRLKKIEIKFRRDFR